MRIVGLLTIPALFFGCSYFGEQTDDKIKTKKIETPNVVQEASQEVLLKEVDRIILDLNKDNKKDTIILFNRVEGEEYFTRAVFKIAGNKGDFVFDNEDGWEAVYPSFLKDNQNKIESKNVFVHNGVVLLCGQIFEGGTVSSLFLTKGNNVNRIDLTEFENPMKIIDLDKDGLVNIIGNNIGEVEAQVDSLEADIISYRPFFVYDVKTDALLLNRKLTRKYNEEHYVWAGLDSVENVKLLQYRDGRKPKIIK